MAFGHSEIRQERTRPPSDGSGRPLWRYALSLSWWVIVPGAVALISLVVSDKLWFLLFIPAMFLIGWARAYLVSGQNRFLFTMIALPLAFGTGLGVVLFPEALQAWRSDRVVLQANDYDDDRCTGVDTATGEPVTWEGRACYRVAGQSKVVIEAWRDRSSGEIHHLPMAGIAQVGFGAWVLGLVMKAVTLASSRARREQIQA